MIITFSSWFSSHLRHALAPHKPSPPNTSQDHILQFKAFNIYVFKLGNMLFLM